ncbi:deaminase [Mycobacterium sp. Aquia_213]|uniref:deaminase n=1 Tax=Mycobacterium sp. Aquia_213 TaxID=2991728 RepID=UPI00226EC096|nr:deaminase [Mycobacterium sp. Aquia_213]WAC92220.1 hypothetical protein LMQ14_03145 [Mycobacterium sp. Aquia_213]
MTDQAFSESDLRRWMRTAVDLGKQSVAEQGKVTPYVGAVVVKDGEVVGSGYRGKTGAGNHAEYGVLKGLADTDLTGAQVFSTLEPCSKRGPDRIPCARRLAEARVSDVWIGLYDQNPVIDRRGWKILRDAGVTVHDFPSDLRDEIALDNSQFMGQYKVATGESGQVTFDGSATAGGILVRSSIGDIQIRTSPMGARGVWLIEHGHNVAAIPYGREFEEIDDPATLRFGHSHFAQLGPSEMACLRSERGYLLLKNVSKREPNVIDLLYQVRGRPVSPEPTKSVSDTTV